MQTTRGVRAGAAPLRVQPLVSVLTPSFNQARWLQDTIDSVANQEYPNVEHIIMDGGSSDETAQILENAPPHVYYRSESDNGQSHALNKALEASSGEIIGWLNSDDAYFSRRAVSVAVEAFCARPDAAVVYGHSALVDGEGRLLHFNWAPPFNRRVLKLHNFIVQPAAFVRRSVIPEFIADEAFGYAMDRELWLRLTHKHPAVRVPEILAIDRHHRERKAYTRLDLYEQDVEILVARYGVPGLGEHRALLKAAKIACRLIGAGLAAQPSRRAEPACAVRSTSTTALLARQTLLPRRLLTA